MLKYRILTALILIPIVVLMIDHAPPWVLQTLLYVIATLAAWEWAAFLKCEKFISRGVYVLLILALLTLTYFLPFHWVLAFSLLMWLYAIIVIFRYAAGASPFGMQYRAVQAIIGVFTIVPCCVGLWALKGSTMGSPWVLFVLALVWSTDSAAYFTGRFLGQHALAPRVSPKKTWEGLFGGLLAALLVAGIFCLFLPVNLQQILEIGLLAIVAALFSVLGDLLESLLKRLTGIKDSGNLFPGHGGLLDRFDSLFAAVPIFALASILMGYVK